MSTTGNIMPVPRRTLLLLRQWQLRLRRGVASAANGILGTRSIGEKVIRLRNLCTGQAPVHFFLKAGGAALGIALAAAPLSSAFAAAGPAPVAQGTVGQSVDDFYRARSGAPLWLAPASGDAAEQLLSLLGTASLDRLDPDKY